MRRTVQYLPATRAFGIGDYPQFIKTDVKGVRLANFDEFVHQRKNDLVKIGMKRTQAFGVKAKFAAAHPRMRWVVIGRFVELRIICEEGENPILIRLMSKKGSLLRTS